MRPPPPPPHHAAAARGTCSLPSSRSRSWFALSGRRYHGELVSPASAGPERCVGDKRAWGDGGIALDPSHGQTLVSCLFSLVWRRGSSWGCSPRPHPQAACPGPASPFLIIGAAGILSKRFSGGSGQAEKQQVGRSGRGWSGLPWGGRSSKDPGPRSCWPGLHMPRADGPECRMLPRGLGVPRCSGRLSGLSAPHRPPSW